MFYTASDFHWIVRKVYKWNGQMELMIELIDLDGCVSYGDTFKEARESLPLALHYWLTKYGEQQLPEPREGAQLIFLEQEMTLNEFHYINQELAKLN